MRTIVLRLMTGLCLVGVMSLAASAQGEDAKEKPRMYTYVADWALPRAKWDDMEKDNVTSAKILDHDVANGTLVGYGNDSSLVHSVDGATHDNWWSATSMAALLNVLEEFHKAPSPPVLTSATKHWDGIYVSRFYNWRPGTYKGVYTHTSSYKLKPGAPNDAVEMLSKNFIAPLLEKLVADGTLLEYEIDEEAIHSESPDMFWIDYIAATPEGLDKTNAALREYLKSNPLGGPAFTSMVDFEPHRDYLSQGDATYK
jgi:hypothetical protein